MKMLYHYLIIGFITAHLTSDASFVTPDKDGNTILHAAVESHNKARIQTLIITNTDLLNKKNRLNHTPLDTARLIAMSRTKNPEIRATMYEISAILKNAGAQSSVILQPKPSMKKMLAEYAQTALSLLH